MTLTIDEIRELLRERKMHYTLSALERAIDDEARELADYRRRAYRRKLGASSCLRAASEFYADEISEFLTNPRQLGPDDILSRRRKATAWAIAELMREYGAIGTE